MNSGATGPVGPSNPPSWPRGANGPYGGPYGFTGSQQAERTPVLTVDRVPGRPGAVLVAAYDHDLGTVVGSVSHSGSSSTVFVFDGESFDWDLGPAGPDGPGDVPDRGLSPAERLAFKTLYMSGDFCKSQAWSDLPAVRRDPAWQGFLDEVRALFSVCGVMMT